MEKNIWKILSAIIVITLFIITRPIRTESVMKSIAINEFENIQMYDSLRKQLTGPVIIDKGKYLEFKWYKVLEWNDSARLYIDIFKKPIGQEWKSFFSPRITMDWQWYYFLFPNGTSTFADVLPSQQKNLPIDSSKYKPYHRQNEMPDSINFIVIPDRLFYFLQKGYFTVVDEMDTYTIVDFYEPIANIVHRHAKETLSTMSAKVFVNDSLEVFILPYDVPTENRNKNEGRANR